jgi:hypothetical protein
MTFREIQAAKKKLMTTIRRQLPMMEVALSAPARR